MNKLFSILIIVLIFAACNNNKASESDLSKCKDGAPYAVFANDMNGINKHSFEQFPSYTSEKVHFEKGFNLELQQSGCEKPKQEFIFRFSRDLKSRSDSIYIAKTISTFRYIAGLDTRLNPFNQWAEAIESIPDLKISEETDLRGTFSLKLDKIDSANEIMLYCSIQKK